LFPLKDNIPTERLPVVTLALLIANVFVYFFLQEGGWELTTSTTGQWPIEDYAAVPCELSDRCPSQGAVADPTTVLTAMFMHGGLLHLGGNMLFLWIFGNNVEDAMGPVKFVVFYLLGGVAAFALQTVIDPDAAVPTVGASGAVAAVLGGYLLLFPRARVLTVIFIVFFFTLIQIPAVFVLGFWFLQQVLFGYFDLNDPAGGGGGVAYFAHIGGFVFGLLAIRLVADRDKAERARQVLGR
jgi:membrane associated rhomboid family serine protease